MSIQTNWKGSYLNGKTADKQPVEIQLLREGLRISTQSGDIFLWAYQEITQTQGFYKNEPVKLEREKISPEILILSDQEFLTSLHQFLPGAAKRFHNPALRGFRLRVVLYATIGLMAVGILVYLWGIPLAAEVFAPHIPLAWEQGMGRSALGVLAPEKSRCRDKALQEAIDEIVVRLHPHGSSPSDFKVVVVKSPIVNAIALPGGNIIVFSGLLEKMDSPESLAAVLAHEMQHIRKRHVTRRIIEDSSTGIMISALSGDVTGSMLYGMKIARNLAMLRYSRHEEDEADAEGLKMLMAANLDPEAAIRFYMMMKEKNRGLKIPQYLSTHPDLDQRISRMKTLISSLDTGHRVYTKLSAGNSWSQIRSGCAVIPASGRNVATVNPSEAR